MRQVAASFVLALVLISCTKDGESETTENAGDDSGTEDEVGSESDTTGTAESDGESDDVPDCTPGALFCTCAEGDVCSPDLICEDGMCTYSDCPASYDGCPCGAGDSCMDGLFCVDGTCGCLPGSLGCGCTDGTTCDNDLSCISGECWLPSPYPNCGWDATHEYYFCGFNIAHPDYPIECPADLMEGAPCPVELTYIGCCDAMGTWWCQGGVTTFAAC